MNVTNRINLHIILYGLDKIIKPISIVPVKNENISAKDQKVSPDTSAKDQSAASVTIKILYYKIQDMQRKAVII